jgi:L-ribulose-5-phosphate 3-epimerase
MDTVKNLIGIMQGRLLPKYQGRYQAHPVQYWQNEFSIARQIGLDCIEFILDYNEVEHNPLVRDGGISEIKRTINETDVQVKTICADYFMEQPLHSSDNEVAEQSLSVLRKLLVSAEQLGVTDIVIPCVDQSSLNEEKSKRRFFSVIQSVMEDVENKGINLSLEMDLPPKPFKNLLDKFQSKNITVNYDIGNSASLGFDPVAELDSYGYLISDIHIKDRVLGGGSVVLGQGDADFDRFFDKLTEFDYSGPFIMQAYRDDEGISVFKKQLDWISQYLE